VTHGTCDIHGRHGIVGAVLTSLPVGDVHTYVYYFSVVLCVVCCVLCVVSCVLCVVCCVLCVVCCVVCCVLCVVCCVLCVVCCVL
jgi:hypothetical protein